MKKVKVLLAERSYYVYTGRGLLKKVKTLIPLELLRNPVLVVTNNTIRRLSYVKGLFSSLESAPVVHIEIVPDSEKAKSFKTYNRIIAKLSEIGKKSKPTVIALGGGVVGDVAGFAASTYRRGVPYIQIPTTLLAQVDSSIGGKVAIDLPEAKNIVGSFYQPKAVISDISILSTLPKKEIKNGLAEIIKYGIICDYSLFAYIERNLRKILALNKTCIEYLVWRCVSIKAKIVAKDEYDSKDIRAVLNLGHTFAHAIEATGRYSKQFTHGEAVAIGMVLAGKMALNLGMLPEKNFNRIKSLIKRAKFRVGLKGLNPSGIIKSIQYDKKFQKGKNRFVLPRKIGKVEVVENIPELLIKETLTC